MIRLFSLAALMLWAGSAGARGQAADDAYVRVLSGIHQADALAQSKRSAEAFAKYVESRTDLRRFQQNYPNWNPQMVAFRLDYLANRIASVSDSTDMNLPAFRLLKSTRPLVIAHRGYKQSAPENTLVAFQMAMTAGADLVELDYYHSRDGVPVVIHDATLDRTTDAATKWGQTDIRVDSKTASELKTLDAGQWFHARFVGERLPLLTEALAMIQSNNVTLIERKAGDAAACAVLLMEKGLINKVIVQAFDWSYLRDFHKLAPDQVLGALGPPSSRNGRVLRPEEKRLNAAWLDEIGKTGSRVVVWSREVSMESVADAHFRGLKVWVYTINDPRLAMELLDYGVDGIISDNPAIIWKTLAERKP